MRVFRQSLDGLLNQCKAMPARLRSYSSYEYVTKVLKGYIKVIIPFMGMSRDQDLGTSEH